MIKKRFLPLTLLVLAGCASDTSTRTPVTGVSKSSRPYFVRGSWHHPQKHYEYRERGLASWYGPRFHGKKTACGEVFNQNHLTAAHKTLPLPTVARVTYKGRSVVVVVNDRGPFCQKRIMDLSVEAAKALGTYEKGVAEVDVESLACESKALADYIKCHGSQGMTWREIYDKKIARNGGSTMVTEVIPPFTLYSPGHTKKVKHAIPTSKTSSKNALEKFLRKQRS